MITVAEEIAAVRREIRLRYQVYPRRVATGRMTKQKADYEVAVMEAILDRLLCAEREERLL